MNNQLPPELDRLQEEQRRLRDDLAAVQARLGQEEASLASAREVLAEVRRQMHTLSARQATVTMQMEALARQFAVSPEPELPRAIPVPTAEPVRIPVTPAKPIAQPPPLPKMVVPTSTPLKQPQAAQPEPVTPVRPTIPLTPPQAPAAEDRSIEMRLGTYWLVRVGIVMLLTGLVFLGNYAYKNFIGLLGQAGKVTLLYLFSGGLLGVGAWLYRKQESLKNYAQVLIAGGLASVYFTTYAAHHVPALQVIVSPLVDGVLLLAWAGFMVWLADRQKSEVLALFGVGLAYYTAVMTRVGYFTLYSNLLLAAAAVFFLVRHRWVALGLVSLVATYGGYAFWRFNDAGVWRWATPEEGLWSGAIFLGCYWLIFSAAVFWSRSPRLVGSQRAGLITLNNGAFFALFLMTMIQVRQGGFWKFALIYGSVLLVLAVAAMRWLKDEPQAANTYLVQGLLLCTLGLMTYFAGLQLALVLAVETVMLNMLGKIQGRRLLEYGACITAALSVIWALNGLGPETRLGWLTGAGIGVLLLFNGLYSQRYLPEEKRQSWAVTPAYYTGLALLIWMRATWLYVPANFVGPVLALEGLIFTVSYAALSFAPLTLFGQVFLAVAAGSTMYRCGVEINPLPWWNPALVVALTLAVGHWWQRQRSLALPAQAAQTACLLYGLAFVGVLFAWLQAYCNPVQWMVLCAALAVAVTSYGVLTRYWALAVGGQWFLFASVMEFLRVTMRSMEPAPAWWLALIPVVVTALTAWAGRRALERYPGAASEVRAGIQGVAQLYRWVVVALVMVWVIRFIPEHHWCWVFAILGTALFVARREPGVNERWQMSAVFTLVSLVIAWFYYRTRDLVWLPNILAILSLCGQQQLARRQPERYGLSETVQNVMMLLSMATLWRFVSLWARQAGGGDFYLTVVWAVLALVIFSAGFLLRERVYRWAGLAILGCALGRVVVFDVWKLDTIYRIFSFFALGIVLLVLGFMYNKFQEKIRQWL